MHNIASSLSKPSRNKGCRIGQPLFTLSPFNFASAALGLASTFGFPKFLKRYGGRRRPWASRKEARARSCIVIKLLSTFIRACGRAETVLRTFAFRIPSTRGTLSSLVVAIYIVQQRGLVLHILTGRCSHLICRGSCAHGKILSHLWPPPFSSARHA